MVDEAPQPETPLFKELQGLSKGFGIQRLDLGRRFGHTELWQIWHIGTREPSAHVHRKVLWQLKRLIDALPNDETRLIARMSFNLLDEESKEKNLGQRRKEFLNKYNMPSTQSDTKLRDATVDILEDFVISLRAAPPPATPAAFLETKKDISQPAAALSAPADGPNEVTSDISDKAEIPGRPKPPPGRRPPLQRHPLPPPPPIRRRRFDQANQEDELTRNRDNDVSITPGQPKPPPGRRPLLPPPPPIRGGHQFDQANQEDELTRNRYNDVSIPLPPPLPPRHASSKPRVRASFSSSPQTWPTVYVRRAKYHDEFEAAKRAGAKIIALVGAPGTGKSRLADELVAEAMQPGDARVDLSADDTASLMSDVAGVLSRTGTDVTSLSDNALARAFIMLTCSDNAPDYVVLDNIDDVSIAQRLISPMARSVMVTTSRERIFPDRRTVYTIVVTEMAEDEAVTLVRSLLPTADTKEAQNLAEALGMLPLAIEHVSTNLLADSFFSVAQLCAELNHDPEGVMASTKSPIDRTLSWTYRKVLSRLQELEDDGNMAIRLLELAAFVGTANIPTGLLYPAFLSTIADDATSGMIKFQAARRELSDRHLIRSTGESVSMHPFAQSLFRGMLRSREVEICINLQKGILEKLRSHGVTMMSADSTTSTNPQRTTFGDLMKWVHGRFRSHGLDPSIFQWPKAPYPRYTSKEFVNLVIAVKAEFRRHGLDIEDDDLIQFGTGLADVLKLPGMQNGGEPVSDDFTDVSWAPHLASVATVLVEAGPSVWSETNLAATVLVLSRLRQRSSDSKIKDKLEGVLRRFMAIVQEGGPGREYDVLWFEALSEQIQDIYLTGRVDRAAFISATRLCAGAIVEDTLYRDPSSIGRHYRYVLHLASSLGLAGLHHEALGALAVIDFEDAKLPLRYRADRFRLVGDSQLAIGYFSLARRSYDLAVKIYTEIPDSESTYEEVLLTLRGILDTIVYAGRLEELDSFKTKYFAQYAGRKTYEDLDRIMAAHLHVSVRTSNAQLFMRHRQHWSNAEASENDSLVITHKAMMKEVLMVFAGYQLSERKVFDPAYEYEITLGNLLSALAIVGSFDALVKWRKSISKVDADSLLSSARTEIANEEFSVGEQRIFDTGILISLSRKLDSSNCPVAIARQKVSNICGDVAPQDVGVMLKIAIKVAWDDEFAYWYCEALAMACAAAALTGQLYESLLLPLHEGWTDIQRLDRWEHLTAALACLPDDLDGFRRNFAYLLAY